MTRWWGPLRGPVMARWLGVACVGVRATGGCGFFARVGLCGEGLFDVLSARSQGTLLVPRVGVLFACCCYSVSRGFF